MAATKKHSPAKSSSKTKSAHRKGSQKYWVKNVTTDSTHPSEGLFTKSPTEIARALVSKKVSPKGPGSGMLMLTYFINRAGKGLSPTRRAKLEKAKELLHKKIQQQKKVHPERSVA